jgi:hypothetical protein
MNKRDLSVSMTRANLVVFFIALPVVVLQFALFGIFHPGADLSLTWNFVVFLVVIIVGVIVHELIHGVAWMLAGRKPWSSIKFGFQIATLTPYAHLKEPVEVNAYRIGAFMPGLIVGILPFLLSLATGNTNLFWFSLVHTTAAGGDWLILWLIRNVKAGALVEDHPSNAGCYVLERQ